MTSDWLYEFIWNQRIDVFGQRLYCFLSERQQKHLEHIFMVKQKFCFWLFPHIDYKSPISLDFNFLSFCSSYVVTAIQITDYNSSYQFSRTRVINFVNFLIKYTQFCIYLFFWQETINSFSKLSVILIQLKNQFILAQFCVWGGMWNLYDPGWKGLMFT